MSAEAHQWLIACGYLIALAAMGYRANRDANTRQRLEAEAARKQKYLEYFLANFAEKSTSRQSAAFALLEWDDEWVLTALKDEQVAETGALPHRSG